MFRTWWEAGTCFVRRKDSRCVGGQRQEGQEVLRVSGALPRMEQQLGQESVWRLSAQGQRRESKAAAKSGWKVAVATRSLSGKSRERFYNQLRSLTRRSLLVPKGAQETQEVDWKKTVAGHNRRHEQEARRSTRNFTGHRAGILQQFSDWVTRRRRQSFPTYGRSVEVSPRVRAPNDHKR